MGKQTKKVGKTLPLFAFLPFFGWVQRDIMEARGVRNDTTRFHRCCSKWTYLLVSSSFVLPLHPNQNGHFHCKSPCLHPPRRTCGARICCVGSGDVLPSLIEIRVVVPLFVVRAALGFCKKIQNAAHTTVTTCAQSRIGASKSETAGFLTHDPVLPARDGREFRKPLLI